MYTISPEIGNESDVEQKLIYPLLTAEKPYGLNIPTYYIQTKKNLRKFEIGKGREKKYYFPDYLIVLSGLPLVVIEAKGPGEDMTEAFREARLYAAEVNAMFPTGLNPVQHVIAINSEYVMMGVYDNNDPVQYLVKDLTPYSELYEQLESRISATALETLYKNYIARLPSLELKKPRRMIGGYAYQNEEISTNSFGASIAADFSHIFNPVRKEDREYVVKNGYIPSRRRERYISPIDRVIRAANNSSEIDSTEIEDTSNPKEVLSKFKKLQPLEHQILLLIGSVGAGKSTFVDYLEAVALPRDAVDKSLWIRANMNTAPVSESEIYDWLRDVIIEGCQAALSDIDFDELENLCSVYSVEVNRFNKSIGKILDRDSEAYKIKFSEQIENLLKDKHTTAKAFTRYCATERGKLLIIVLDNCDKRTRDEQLLMFQAAQWVQKEFRSLVILPLRDETYDQYRDKPPLDTALKDLVFKIEPPLFQNILQSRVQLALNEISKSLPKNLYYDLGNGFRVEYASSDMAFYLSSILKSIFEHDKYIRRIITGLSARNMRRALEIFLEFCTSGHIPEDQIFKIRQSEGRFALPLHLVVRVLLRMNRRFYDNDFSYLKNIFSINWQDTRANYFVRLMILRWLFSRISEFGPTRLKGYFPILSLKEEFVSYGFEATVINREIEALVKGHCIVSEDFRTEELTDTLLIKIAPAGVVHIDMLENVYYLGAIAEDTYFDDYGISKAIADRIFNPDKHYTKITAIQNARELLNYLDRVQKEQFVDSNKIIINNDFNALSDLTPAFLALKDLEGKVVKAPWVQFSEKYSVGHETIGLVTAVKDYGCFVEMEGHIYGLLHKSQYNLGESWLPMVGDKLKVEILEINIYEERLSLSCKDLIEV